MKLGIIGARTLSRLNEDGQMAVLIHLHRDLPLPCPLSPARVEEVNRWGAAWLLEEAEAGRDVSLEEVAQASQSVASALEAVTAVPVSPTTRLS